MKDDQYFQIAVAAESAYFDSNATAIWKKSVLPGLNREPLIVSPARHSLKAKLSQSAIKTVLTTATGIKTGDAFMIPFEKARTERVVKRIVKGLLWDNYNRQLAMSTPMEVFIKPPINGMEQILYGLELRSIGEIFRYRHGLTVDDVGSIWWLQFYGGTHFIVIVGRQPSGTVEDVSGAAC
jgi:hypothetical protein